MGEIESRLAELGLETVEGSGDGGDGGAGDGNATADLLYLKALHGQWRSGLPALPTFASASGATWAMFGRGLESWNAVAGAAFSCFLNVSKFTFKVVSAFLLLSNPRQSQETTRSKCLWRW